MSKPIIPINIAELFAGVGGFRCGYENAFKDVFQTVFANQWEPDGKESKQFAHRCYESHFGKGSCVNEDIHKYVNSPDIDILPRIDLVCAGFPCQDYSVAKSLSTAKGIEGKKGVLWWDLYAFVEKTEPKRCFFENVDRLLKSPAKQRGRDFAVMLSCMRGLGYSAEWMVINAADWGFPQKRRRLWMWFIQSAEPEYMLSQTFPIDKGDVSEFDISLDTLDVSNNFGKGKKRSSFLSYGAMSAKTGRVKTCSYTPLYQGEKKTLRDVLIPLESVADAYKVSSEDLPKWQYFKSGKRIQRVSKDGHAYIYSEGAMDFPDSLDKPARTILTSESGTASRTSHIVYQDGVYRKLTPIELERLQGFSDGWTDTGMTERQRAFCMGNALVVGIVEKVFKTFEKNLSAQVV